MVYPLFFLFPVTVSSNLLDFAVLVVMLRIPMSITSQMLSHIVITAHDI